MAKLDSLSNRISPSWLFPSGSSTGLLLLWVVLVVADLLKHAVVLGADPPPPQLDAFAYWELGGQLAQGDWLLQDESGAFRTPGLPLFLAPFHLLLGRYALFGALVAQHFLVISTSLATAAICGRVTTSSWAALAGYGLSALCFSRDWHANLILSETLFTLLLVMVVAALVQFLHRPSMWAAAAIGASLGLATLVRPISTYLWVPLGFTIMVAWLMHHRPATSAAPRRRSWVSAITASSIMVVALALVLAPWLLRNQVMFGSPFMTRFLGRNLWVVTFGGESGAGLKLGDGPASIELREHLQKVDLPVRMEEEWEVSDALAASGMSDDEIDALMLRVCRELIADARPLVAYKTFRRTVNFWRCVSNPFPFYPWNSEQSGDRGQWVWRSPTATTIYKRLNEYAASRSLRMNELVLLCVILGLAGLGWRAETRSLAIGLALVLLYFDVVTATLEIPGYRYRMILEPVMIVCFVGGTAKWLGCRQQIQN